MKKSVLVLTPLAVFLSAASWPLFATLKTASLNQALCRAASQEDAAVDRLLARGASPRAVGAVSYTNCDSGTPDCRCTTAPLPALSLAVADPATDYSDPRDPRAVAAYDEALGTAAALLRAGADVNAAGGDALGRARSPRMVRLLAHGAKVDLRGKGGVTVLMGDTYSFRLGEMKALLAAGADVNARDSHGRTALMSAVDHLEDDPGTGAVKLLIAAGADVNARDDQGKTALAYAREEKQAESISLLKKT